MSRVLRCQQGHQWEFTADDANPDAAICPVCGNLPASSSTATSGGAIQTGPRKSAPRHADAGETEVDERIPHKPRARAGRSCASAQRGDEDEGGIGKRTSSAGLLVVIFFAIVVPLTLLVLAGGLLVWWTTSNRPPRQAAQPVAGVFGPGGVDNQGGAPSAVFSDHPGTVTALAFTSNDTLAVGTGHSDDAGKTRTGAIKLWNLATNQGRQAAGQEHGVIEALAATRDGRTLASAGSGSTVQLWDMPAGTGRQLLSLRGKDPSCLAISADGTTVAMGDGGGTSQGVLVPGEIFLWDVVTDKERARMKGHAGMVHALAFSPDGRTLASTSADRTVRLWDTGTGQELAKMQGHHDAVWGVAFSPDGRLLATGSNDGAVMLWDVVAKKALEQLSGAPGGVTGVAFSADGRDIVAGTGVFGAFGEVWVWDVRTRRVREIFKGHSNIVSYVAISPDGRKVASASAGRGEPVFVWDVPAGK